MLATTASPCCRAIRHSDRCPACRLPIVGTKAVRLTRASRCLSSAALWTISMRFRCDVGLEGERGRNDPPLSEAMLGCGEGAVLHRGDIRAERRLDAVVADH